MIKPGNRNTYLFQLAKDLVAQGKERVVVEGEIMAVNQESCKPPVCDQELFAVVERAWHTRPVDEHQRLADAAARYIQVVDPDFSGDMPSWFDNAGLKL